MIMWGVLFSIYHRSISLNIFLNIYNRNLISFPISVSIVGNSSLNIKSQDHRHRQNFEFKNASQISFSHPTFFPIGVGQLGDGGRPTFSGGRCVCVGGCPIIYSHTNIGRGTVQSPCPHPLLISACQCLNTTKIPKRNYPIVVYPSYLLQTQIKWIF